MMKDGIWGCRLTLAITFYGIWEYIGVLPGSWGYVVLDLSYRAPNRGAVLDCGCSILVCGYLGFLVYHGVSFFSSF